ncbi:hypothetical protein Rhow_007656 [Rhodococcus wratislaviensis]|uniref:Uncharacterized protein n=1 Tax=Rhodococcus wratislaviensis TaxID=44752 RepID=A0A402CII1_RHOWR|nr:hypothetical protein Rhow_007656 [Rhodococcus wratislaviensis]
MLSVFSLSPRHFVFLSRLPEAEQGAGRNESGRSGWVNY